MTDFQEILDAFATTNISPSSMFYGADIQEFDDGFIVLPQDISLSTIRTHSYVEPKQATDICLLARALFDTENPYNLYADICRFNNVEYPYLIGEDFEVTDGEKLPDTSKIGQKLKVPNIDDIFIQRPDNDGTNVVL